MAGRFVSSSSLFDKFGLNFIGCLLYFGQGNTIGSSQAASAESDQKGFVNLLHEFRQRKEYGSNRHYSTFGQAFHCRKFRLRMIDYFTIMQYIVA